MSIYYSIDEALNRPQIPEEWTESIVTGCDGVCQFVSNLILQHAKYKKRTCLLALDGFLGVEWKSALHGIKELLKKEGLKFETIDFSYCYKSPSEIKKIAAPFLTNDPSFGFVFNKRLENFLNSVRLQELRKRLKNYKRKSTGPLLAGVMCFGCGAAIPRLRKLYDLIFYMDLTREELLNRSLKKPVYPLGSIGEDLPVHRSLKRLYYVDFQVLDRHKKYALRHMDWYMDGNIVDVPKLLPRNMYDGILSTLAQYPFRVKPLYYPVTWGGTWLKRIRELPESMINSGQACILPWENSVRIGLNDTVLEIPFLNLLWKEPIKIMGEYAFKKFRDNFPMVYYYDDGYEGGNMAIQVHPNTAYIEKHFNESMRQDESYYILCTGPGAKTYLGLKEDADLDEFRQACVKAEKEGVPFEYDKYVNSIPTKPGDYFLIPAGTIHASGRNQVVLEIDGYVSAYGSGYTFHFYDYLRPDLDGTPRPIHLKHAFGVLKKTRRAKWVAEHLKQEPKLLRAGKDWAEYIIGERKDMFYKVHRLEFETKIEDNTKGKFHVLTLVKGKSIIVQSHENPQRKFTMKFTETLIVPACLGRYTMLNLGSKSCKATKALIR